MKICITGDSWACGEWELFPDGSYLVTHRGLDEYLSERHDVVNLGVAGSSNDSAIARLKECVQYHRFDYIFWFKTDPIRDFDFDKFLEQPTLTLDNVFEKINAVAFDSYQSLNDLGVPVHCIGGCNKLNVALMQQFNNLVPYIPCLSEMLEPEYTHPEIWFSDWHDRVRRQFDYKSLSKLLDYSRQQYALRNYKKYFWPDGVHPNRYGHKVLYKKICTDFNL